MRTFLYNLILVLLCCVGTFAQTSKILPCPSILITGPPSIPKFEDETITYSVILGKDAEKYNVKYVWTVYGGEIIYGQGTPIIVTTWKNERNSIIATIKIEGLPEHCDNARAEVMHYTPAPEPEKFDEVSLADFKLTKDKNDKLIDVLKNDPSVQLFVIFYFKKNSPKKLLDRKMQKIENFLTNVNKIDKERITKVKGVTEKKEFVQFWLVPTGVMPPTPEEH